MKTGTIFAASLLLCAAFSQAETVPVSGSVPAAQRRYLARLAGSYVTDAPFDATHGRVDVRWEGDSLVMTSDFDLSGWKCGSGVGSLSSIEIFPKSDGGVDPDAPEEANFQFDKGSCSNISGDVVTLHYNRSLLGTDVFLIELVRVAGSRDSRGQVRGRDVLDWPLKKVQ